MTPLQKIQKDRSYFKFVISGLPKPIQLESLSDIEKQLWKELLSIRKSLLDNFEETSRTFGLKVPKNRCWCGKEGKYESKDGYFKGLVCKKHIDI